MTVLRLQLHYKSKHCTAATFLETESAESAPCQHFTCRVYHSSQQFWPRGGNSEKNLDILRSEDIKQFWSYLEILARLQRLPGDTR